MFIIIAHLFFIYVLTIFVHSVDRWDSVFMIFDKLHTPCVEQSLLSSKVELIAE